MRVLSFMTADIEVLTPVIVTERGAERADWTQEPTTTTVVPDCSIQPGSPTETLGDRDASEVRWTVFAPPGIAVDAYSAVRIMGDRYQVDGEPQRWVSPTGDLDHTVIRLVDWKG